MTCWVHVLIPKNYTIILFTAVIWLFFVIFQFVIKKLCILIIDKNIYKYTFNYLSSMLLTWKNILGCPNTSLNYRLFSFHYDVSCGLAGSPAKLNFMRSTSALFIIYNWFTIEFLKIRHFLENQKKSQFYLSCINCMHSFFIGSCIRLSKFLTFEDMPPVGQYFEWQKMLNMMKGCSKLPPLPPTTEWYCCRTSA